MYEEIEILVADDEEDIRTIYKRAFEERGYEVTLTADGEECLVVYHHKTLLQVQEQQHYYHDHHLRHEGRGSSSFSLSSFSSSLLPSSSSSSPFDVVILDYMMPKRDGLQVAKEILKINPKQRIIFASAYVGETLEESLKELKRVSRDNTKAILNICINRHS